MKIEKVPSTDISRNILDDIISKVHKDFLESVDAKYMYWDEVKYHKDLPYKEIEKVWSLIKLNRSFNYKTINLSKYNFNYYLTPQIQKELHEFDLKMIGGLYINPISDFEKAEYLKNSLLEEAIASSQIEGAATTTKIAWDMLKSGRNPRNESEQMIFNNLRAIKYIVEGINETLDFKFIIELHQIMTANTSAEECAGNFRKGEIFVQDAVDGEIAHIPPQWEDVEKLMNELCVFANSEKEFIHPIVKASMIHFFIGFIHPFKDGNGRTARALFYWYLIKKGYVLVKNISISRAILESRIQYDKAYLKTENDENDLTYFINYSIKSLRVAFESLVRYRDKKKNEKEKSNLISYKLLSKNLNKRQADLLGHLYTKPNSHITINSYSQKHDIVRQTARKDLSELEKLGLIIEDKKGRNVVFKLVSTESIDNYLGKL